MGGQVDPLGTVKEIQIWPYKQMLYARPHIYLWKWDGQTPQGFWDTNWTPNLGQTNRPYDKRPKKENLQNLGLCSHGWQKNKWKESEKKDKYLDLAKELKKLWNMKMTIIPVAIGTLGTVTKRLIQALEDLEVRGQMDPIQIS